MHWGRSLAAKGQERLVLAQALGLKGSSTIPCMLVRTPPDMVHHTVSAMQASCLAREPAQDVGDHRTQLARDRRLFRHLKRAEDTFRYFENILRNF